LDDFGDMLAKVITVICILVWLVNIRHFNDPMHKGWMQGAVYYFKIAVALAVAAIPEGLAAVITACLALGTKKMAKRGAIVRSLPSVETLGCTSVICSDKTGTLTTNQMCVSKVSAFSNGKGDMMDVDVSGSSYEPTGEVIVSGKSTEFATARSTILKEVATICSLCNDARITYDHESQSYTNVGEPTEAALQVLVEKLGTDSSSINQNLSGLSPGKRATACTDHFRSQYTRTATLEFTRERKSMSVLVNNGGNGKISLLVKGAPESIIERCTKIQLDNNVIEMTEALRTKAMSKVLAFGGEKALRCIALAKIENVTTNDWNLKEQSLFAKYESNMTFVGLVGMMDPPREEVKKSIKNCKTAGIRVIVITGDNKNTAESICRQIGIFEQDEDLSKKSFTGREFDALSTAEKIEAVKTASLFSRTEPAHKQQLVDMLQSLGEIVAMVYIYIYTYGLVYFC
jgi:Ca2+ transporting ATPase